ncbi:extracellular solute-binding protein family 3 [Xylanimonas cellulosilytica DSM 15894]|uniref:Extracellular solute-binding protein family 3 n=1 Tax=Xylanimonas cellulosilytica (strain DSM 15894 / JCM 12276 / CECT 5975 / KCTC 9989 / LMG 20990 / NBRC 107835 / XIL07) TaxID=446471 RepID=D1BTW4_XYLCX|nr:ABC transporter substrate-binding protein [Xylanimonas cellulosilytica]ACZ29128.1 extracellular solute-binding protein family 3 [Xylanimonas cellulosilytica DSM 15894]
MRTRPALLVATAVAATLTLGACTSASQDQGGSAPSAAATVVKDEAIAALVPAAVAADGKLTVAAELSYAPLEFVDADGKTPVGLDIDIATAIATVMGLEVDVQSAQFDSIIPAIGTRYEVGVSAFTITPERLETVTMVSYFSAGSQLAVQAGNPDGVDPDDLCGLTVGVQTGTVQQEELEELSAACETPIEILPYDSQATVTANLVGGKLQAMYADSPITAYAVEQADGALETLGEIRDAAPYGVVVAKDDPELAEAVRAALQQLMDDGTLAEIAAHWGNEAGALTTAEINPAV